MRIELFTNKPDEKRKFDLIEELVEDIDYLYDQSDYDAACENELERAVLVEIREKKLKYKLELLKDLTNAKI